MSSIEEAAEWFVALRDDGGNATQRARFSEWLLQSPEHVRIYLELTSIWAEAAALEPRPLDAKTLIARARSESNVVAFEGAEGSGVGSAAAAGLAGLAAAADSAGSAAASSAASSGAPRPARRFWLAASVAAAAIVAVLWQTGRPTVYSTGIGEQRSIALIDGSRIELNARSRLQVRLSEKERAIDLLEGQGLFRVAKDPKRPFIVRSGGTQVQAVGTEFDVYVKPGGTVVSVVEGRVEIRTASPVGIASPSPSPPPTPSGPTTNADRPRSLRATSIQLAAGEQAVVAPNEIARLERANIEAATAWTHRRLVFDASALGDVAAEFNRYNFRRIVIADAQIQAFPISGVFSSSDPTSLVQFLMEQPEIQVEQTASEVIVSRKKQ